ncbi:Tetracycline resistance protein TetA/multidrug resistance protein MdtG [Penicillium taxi]|uniref:Tetracycline resistance protein TetA/multidrug resistance protein MdtG n=1 Tax=Penicillium taxi TaxID=168475 RepID=UPI002544E06A|nr:Tetracycline resistance protein TetA/multidrug resistance protein MdtG [Penicillium taxi]KAJ5907565.1 Tetracycline resistance protein TetA/multidrug resistance protein MdtG [Penicillium taxi]
METTAFKLIPRRRPPWLLGLRSSTTFIIITVWMSTFTEFFLYAMIVPVMPTALSHDTSKGQIRRSFVQPFPIKKPTHKKIEEYWISILLASEAGTALLFCPIFGYFVDRTRTRKAPFICALTLLAGCMVILHISHSLTLFMVSRALEGCASALAVVSSFALLSDSVLQEYLGQTIGLVGSAIACGFLFGPFLGGLLFHNCGYDAVFYAAYLLVLVDLVLRTGMIEKKVASSYLSSENGIEFESAEPGLEQRDMGFALFKILRQRRVLISSWGLLVQGILLSAFDTTLSIFVETRYGWSTLGMGLIFLPLGITAFFQPLFGSITDRHGARIMAFTCFFLLSPALICLGFVEKNSTESITLLIILLTIIGIFIHACTPAMYVETQLTLAAMELKDPGLFGPKSAVAQGFGLQSMCQFAGLFFGPLWGGFVEYRFGWGVMTGTLGVLTLLTALPMLWLSGTEIQDEERQPLLNS